MFDLFEKSAHREEWKKAKANFQKKASGNFSKKGLSGFGKGADFGPALKKFDLAKSLDDKKAKIPAVLKAVDKYRKMIKALEKDPQINKAGTACLTGLKKSLESIWKDIERSVQPPKPSGRAAKVKLVSSRNAAGGLRPQWLDVGSIDINAYLVVDELVNQLEGQGELGYSWINLQSECNALVEKSTKAFAETIQKIDASLASLTAGQRAKKIKQANEVLNYYAKLVEKNVNKIVDKYWAGIISRQKYLKAFKKECKVDIACSTITIATSVTAIATSFGTAAVSGLAIAKAVADIAVVAQKLTRTAEGMESRLYSNMDKIVDLCVQRKQAKADGRGQKMSKAGQAAKEASTTLFGQVTSLLMTTVSRTNKEAKEYYGKLSELEKQAGKMYKKIDEAASKFSSTPQMPPGYNQTEFRNAFKQFKIMKKDFEQFNRNLQKKIEYGRWAIDVCGQVQDEDYVPAATKPGTSCLAMLIGIYACCGVVINVTTGINISPI
ncbi:hypothetical protein N9B31_05915 [Mariniblastus sp.]|nr:hypothetical protein [Mariniblastus sp.]MDB4399688.1 hypothetical protein [bacterium]